MIVLDLTCADIDSVTVVYHVRKVLWHRSVYRRNIIQLKDGRQFSISDREARDMPLPCPEVPISVEAYGSNWERF